MLARALKKSRDSCLNGALFEKFLPEENYKLSGGTVFSHVRYIDTATLCVGPLRFEDTKFYFVHYSNSPIEPFAKPNISYVNPQWNELDYRPDSQKLSPGKEKNTLDLKHCLLPSPEYKAPPAKKPEDYEASPGEPVEPLITDASLQRLKSRANEDPTIFNILKRISKGLGTPEQCMLLHNELIGPSTFPLPKRAKKPPRKRITLSINQQDKDEFFDSLINNKKEVRRHFDIVMEFSDAPDTKWIFPRESVLSHVFNTDKKKLEALSLLFHVYRPTEDRNVIDVKTEIKIRDFTPTLRSAIELLTSGTHADRLLSEKRRRMSNLEPKYYMQFHEQT